MLLQVWAMKRDELGAAVRALLAADRDIYEHCVGGDGEWQPPSTAASLAQALDAPAGIGAIPDATTDAANAVATEASVMWPAVSAEHESAADKGADADSSASERSERRSRAARSHRAEPDTALWRQLGEIIDGRRCAQWRAAEKELQQCFALLQARAAAANGVDRLRAEQRELQARVEQLRRDPINQHLQLPPSLFLNGCLQGDQTVGR